ncbi:hypothetical protein [Mucilaginibacter pedocola]|uniref:Uncharacterized protein n=1 Tax=Mucilaginibacter pedocola TaxID=1792845 RepID=A0A1S9PFS4_9SPHI|nr:hypothetical protein [Mucilaginibacter pedocola]OOQ59804.1 hypothetical protein BC343_06560 [Mucilaginibacter pedocola]
MPEYSNPDNLLQRTILNNAEWCGIICATHGAPGSVQQNIWRSPGPVPPYYPDLVTLSSSIDTNAVVDAMRGLPLLKSLKDSFNSLELEAHGFHKLFEAQWVNYADETETTIDFKIADTSEKLQAWEKAWGNDKQDRIFKDSLLQHPEIKFVYHEDYGKIISGGIIHTSHGVAGLSNFFCRDNSRQYRSALVAFAQALPVVGYESGDALQEAVAIGGKKMGPLSVWVKV